MKRAIVLLACLLLVNTCCLSKHKLVSIPVGDQVPKWVEEYEKKLTTPKSYFSNGGVKHAVNKRSKDLVYVEEASNNFRLTYKKGKNTNHLLTSQEGFLHPQWSGDNKYFSVVNVTYAEDIVCNGDIYIYKTENDRQKLVYREKNMGATPGFFSNNNRSFAYWSQTMEHNALVLVDLQTGKKTLLNLMLDPTGAATMIAWSRNDKEMYVIYVVHNSPAYYLVKNIK